MKKIICFFILFFIAGDLYAQKENNLSVARDRKQKRMVAY